MEATIVKDLIRCVNFAAIKHRDQRRKDDEQTPYINHPIGVANILISEGNVTDLNVIQAAILHDTVEDTDTTFEEIDENFGTDVGNIVREVSDDKTLDKNTRKQEQIDNAPGRSRNAKLVMLADKIYNLRDLQRCAPFGWTEKRVEEYFVWASKVFNGLKNTNPDLEAILEDIFEKRWSG